MLNRKNVNNVLLKTAQYAQEKLLKYTSNNNTNNSNNNANPNNTSPNNQLNIVTNYFLNFPSLALLVNNVKILEWVIDQAKLLKPQSIRVINGSEEENTELIELLLSQGTLIKLNEEYPNCYAAFSDPSDVARVEKQTFICRERT